MRAIESTKRKLEHLRKRGSEDHQKLTSSEVLKIIRSWKCVKCCFNQAYHCRRIEAEATDKSEDFGRHWMLILWRTMEKGQ